MNERSHVQVSSIGEGLIVIKPFDAVDVCAGDFAVVISPVDICDLIDVNSKDVATDGEFTVATIQHDCDVTMSQIRTQSKTTIKVIVSKTLTTNIVFV